MHINLKLLLAGLGLARDDLVLSLAGALHWGCYSDSVWVWSSSCWTDSMLCLSLNLTGGKVWLYHDQNWQWMQTWWFEVNDLLSLTTLMCQYWIKSGLNLAVLPGFEIQEASIHSSSSIKWLNYAACQRVSELVLFALGSSSTKRPLIIHTSVLSYRSLHSLVPVLLVLKIRSLWFRFLALHSRIES